LGESEVKTTTLVGLLSGALHSTEGGDGDGLGKVVGHAATGTQMAGWSDVADLP
jgi:hypothetical protein